MKKKKHIELSVDVQLKAFSERIKTMAEAAGFSNDWVATASIKQYPHLREPYIAFTAHIGDGRCVVDEINMEFVILKMKEKLLSDGIQLPDVKY